MSHFRQAMLSFYWFASNMHWAAILITTLPRQALLIGGDEVKGGTLGLVLLIGAFVSMIVAPIFGALSDRIVTPIGRRRPWIITAPCSSSRIDSAFAVMLGDYHRALDLS